MFSVTRRIQPAGAVNLRVIRQPHTAVPARVLSLPEILQYGYPQRWQAPNVRAWRMTNIPHLWRGLWRVMCARALKIPHFYGQLSLVVIRADGTWEDYGLASLRVVTDVGVGFIVDAFQGTVEPENMRYHGLGTGTTAEAASQTALVTELSTAYNPDNTRATGSLTEGATANIFRTVGTNTVDGAAAVTEHGIFSQAATGGGVLFDRSVFSAINLANGDSLQTTYDLTLTSGS